MSEQSHRSKITVEDLLRLKRAERPSPEFWVGFEQELRQKQLAALLERRSWWQGIPQFLSRRTYLPIGATAALAFTLITVRHYTASPSVRTDAPVEPVSALSQQASAAPAASMSEVSTTVSSQSARHEETPLIDDRTAVAANTSLSDKLPEHAADLTPWSAPRSVETPSSRSIAATIANLEQTHPELASAALGGRVPAGNRIDDAVLRTAELAGVAAVASKRSRLLAQFDDRHFSPEPQAPEVLRERLTRRMAHQDFNDRYSRVDLQADRVLVKF